MFAQCLDRKEQSAGDVALGVFLLGTDIDDESKLIANRMSLEETAKFIGADSLGHISIEGIKQACSGCSLDLCTGCFDGNYPMEIGHHKKSEFEC